MANTPSSNGKGSARRTENLAKVRENWDSIDWSKGRPAAKPAPPPQDPWTVWENDPKMQDLEYQLNGDDDLRPY